MSVEKRKKIENVQIFYFYFFGTLMFIFSSEKVSQTLFVGQHFKYIDRINFQFHPMCTWSTEWKSYKSWNATSKVCPTFK